MPESRPRTGFNQLWVGLGLSIPLHIILLPLSIFFWRAMLCIAQIGDSCGAGGIYAIMIVGATQLTYMLPAILLAWLTGRIALMQGLIISAAIVILLNGACWGLLGLFAGVASLQ